MKVIPLPKGHVKLLAEELGIHENTLRIRFVDDDIDIVRAVREYRDKLELQKKIARKEKAALMQSND